MAATFGCDPVVAGQVSRALAAIHTDMDTLGTLFDDFDGATGSNLVESALDEFFSKSSDNRKRMGKLLDRASGLLRALAQGTAAIDSDLAKALPPLAPTAGQPPAGASLAARGAVK